MINSGDAPFIISCRSAEDYANGHIPGAVNIGIGSIADNLDKLPPDETIVVYCYTGHTAAQVTALLNMLGYDAKSLKFGMCSWSSDETVLAGKCFDPANDQNDFTVAGGAVSESEFDVVKDAVAAYVASPAANIKAGDLNDLVTADEAPYLISLRSADDFANGHITGSVNIAFGDLFKTTTLDTLPDEDIVTYCYTGQTASMATALLGQQTRTTSRSRPPPIQPPRPTTTRLSITPPLPMRMTSSRLPPRLFQRRTSPPATSMT